jgi:hypothetical protein
MADVPRCCASGVADLLSTGLMPCGGSPAVLVYNGAADLQEFWADPSPDKQKFNCSPHIFLFCALQLAGPGRESALRPLIRCHSLLNIYCLTLNKLHSLANIYCLKLNYVDCLTKCLLFNANWVPFLTRY